MGCCGAEQSEIWDSGLLVTSMWGTFSLLVFKVIWGSFGALGHWSHEYLMSLRGFPKDCVVHGNSPQRAVVIWKAWLLGVHADTTFLDGKGQ